MAGAWLHSAGQFLRSAGFEASPTAGERQDADRAERARKIREVCGRLELKLGLQADSVRNQREHVEALWESFAARHDSDDVALWDLASQLLHTVREWEARVWVSLFVPVEREVPESEDPLRDICLYLLLWGELGQLRFCPELLAFLFHAARRHCCATFQPLVAPEPCSFLNSIVKPIFGVFLRETFEPGEPPRFRYGSAPAPSGACNYDDWNELFWDARRLRRALVLESTARRKPPLLRQETRGEDVWALLPDVDWAASLRGAKSHREVHSMLPLLVGSYRIFMLISLPFASMMLYWTEKQTGVTWWHFAPLGLLAPAWLLLHEIGFQILTPAMALRKRLRGLMVLVCIHLLPVASFVALFWVRGRPPLYKGGPTPEVVMLVIHFAVSAIIFLLGLAPRSRNPYRWRFYPAPSSHHACVTGFFWLLVFAVKALFDVLLAQYCGAALHELLALAKSDDAGVWLISAEFAVLLLPVTLSSAASLLLFANFAVALTGAMRGVRILGGAKLFWYRRGLGLTSMPERICSRVLRLEAERPLDCTGLRALKWWNRLGDRELAAFIEVWNATVHELRERDLLGDDEASRLSLEPIEAVRRGRVPRLLDPLNVPIIHSALPSNREARRRIVTLAQSVQMQPLPSANLQEAPMLSVLVPHYTETIRFDHEDLFTAGGSAELLRFLVKYYEDEFANFAERISARPAGADLEAVSQRLRSDIGEELCKWASLRMQTLWRTADGVCQAYARAWLLLSRLQAPLQSHQELEELVRRKLQVVLAVQRYARFADPESHEYDAHSAAAVEALLESFGRWMCIAYLEEEDTGHGRRYFACLVDASCPMAAGSKAAAGPGMRKPKFRIELPGHPILGHGKSDNQNCAIVFTRGEVLQTIDANQEAYFELALLLPLALREFGAVRNGRRPGILGFREHIFSDVGIMGRLAADSEFAFGTVIQRTMDWPLGARLHYGHPDMVDKLQMLQQGGISKGTRGLNLSEDVFAGIDLVLRGGWTAYREYFQVGKGRDMGFMSVLSFYAKISMGNGEQAITRQWMRLGLQLPLPRLLGIFYMHVGYYLNQCLVNWSVKAFAFMAAFFSLHASFDRAAAGIAVQVTANYFGLFYLFFLIASMAPLLLEEFVEFGLRRVLASLFSALLSLSPVFAAFQSKLMGHYFATTVRYGGAQYIPTGRGLATSREPFGKLFRVFSVSHMYDGFEIAILLCFSIGTTYGVDFYTCMALSVVSFVFAPFLFNPRQFESPHLALSDLRAWGDWLCTSKGSESESWVTWAARLQDLRSNKSKLWIVLPSERLLTVACSTALMLRMWQLRPYTASWGWLRSVMPLAPPLAHAVPCLLLSPMGALGTGPPYLVMAAIALSVTAFEFAIVPWDDRFAVILFHKYCCLRFLVEAADGVAAHRLGGCLASPLHNACRLWSLSWKFLRDLFLGLLLLLWCTVMAALPGVARLHGFFLFRAQPRSGEPRETSFVAEADEGDGAEVPDEIIGGSTPPRVGSSREHHSRPTRRGATKTDSERQLEFFFKKFAPRVLQPPVGPPAGMD